ncbi:MAG TPA: hypothetical protein VMU50_23810 [Polyangia bacterium]|nr:hypothetical protein [Polyangia bacterium]
MGQLLAALTAVARDDEMAVARLPSEAFAPLSAADRAKIADRILQPQAVEAQQEKPTTADAVVSMVGRRRGSRGCRAAALAPLALAAAVMLVVRSFSGERLGPVPEYEISASGGIKELRGGDTPSSEAAGTLAEPQRLAPQSQLVAIGRPKIAVEGPMAVRAFVVQGAKVEEVWPQLQIAASGAVEVRAPVAAVFGDRTGHWELVVLVGRAAALRRAEPAAALAGPSDGTWRRLVVPLDFEARSSSGPSPAPGAPASPR